MVHAGLYHGAHETVSWSPSWPCCKHRWPCPRPRRLCRRLCRDTPSTKAMRARRVAHYYSCRSPKCRIVAHRGCVAACIATILRYKSRPQPRYKVCIVTRPLLAGQSYRGLYRGPATPCRGCGLAVSWPSPACPGLLCHDTIPLYRDPVGQ